MATPDEDEKVLIEILAGEFGAVGALAVVRDLDPADIPRLAEICRIPDDQIELSAPPADLFDKVMERIRHEKQDPPPEPGNGKMG